MTNIEKLEADLLALDLRLTDLSADYSRASDKVQKAKSTLPDTDDRHADQAKAVALAETERDEVHRKFRYVTNLRQDCSSALQTEVAAEITERNQPMNKFITLYHIELYEFSPAEGGCWATWYEGVACYPMGSSIVRDAVWAYAVKTNTDVRQVNAVDAMKDFFRKEDGLKFKGDIIVEDDGDGLTHSRTVRDYRSTSPEVNHIVCLDDQPFEMQSTERARYE